MPDQFDIPTVHAQTSHSDESIEEEGADSDDSEEVVMERVAALDVADVEGRIVKTVAHREVS